MEDTLFGISAFRYHRVPPQVRLLMPRVPNQEADKARRAFIAHPLFSEALGYPVHISAKVRNVHFASANIKRHFQSCEIPLGHIHETDHEIGVPSPSFTLFQLAQSLTLVQLCMCMYEFCGTFTLYRPSKNIGLALKESTGAAKLGITWRPVCDASGMATGLWTRPPLVEIAELDDLARQMQGARGCRKFCKALELMTGVAASPFEAQLSMLLGFPRSLGGEGFSDFANNKRIALGSKAARIAGRRNCYADLLFEACGVEKPLVIECQGKVVHDNMNALISDSDRATALHHMGYNVLLLTYQQIADEKNFDLVRRLIARDTGRNYREKTQRQLLAQRELRREIFIDWETIGV